FFFQAEDGIRDPLVTGVQTCALPIFETRQALRLIDSEPVLDEELLKLAHWIANYYCAPLGEVLRGMLPLANDIRSGKTYELTDQIGRASCRERGEISV